MLKRREAKREERRNPDAPRKQKVRKNFEAVTADGKSFAESASPAVLFQVYALQYILYAKQGVSVRAVLWPAL